MLLAKREVGLERAARMLSLVCKGPVWKGRGRADSGDREGKVELGISRACRSAFRSRETRDDAVTEGHMDCPDLHQPDNP